MTKAQDVHVEKIKWFDVQGDLIEAAFVVGIAALNWSKAQVDAFSNALQERYPDLFAYDYHYERIRDGSEMLRPTNVERFSCAWSRKIAGPELRKDVEREFAGRRHAVLSMLADYSGKLNVE